jgi:hypothetical protein
MHKCLMPGMPDLSYSCLGCILYELKSYVKYVKNIFSHPLHARLETISLSMLEGDLES